VELRCTNLLDEPSIRGIVVNAHDISGRKRAESELEYQAFHDTLTALPNRALLRDRIEHAITRRSRGGHGVAVMYCDLDGFKIVNDTLGHDAGDAILRIAARRLSESVRPGDTVGRLGGDEFAVILEGGPDLVDEALLVGQRLLARLAEPIEIEGTPLIVTGSLGLAFCDARADVTADELLRDADAAMYRAKRNGRSLLVQFTPNMRMASLERLRLEADLQAALANDEIVVHYQPVVDLRSGVIRGFEALVRWQHPTRGLLQPAEFIPMAEETGAIVEIGGHVLDVACEDAQAWPEVAGAPVSLAVNVSARQIAWPGLVDRVDAALQRTGLPAAGLVLELTETLLMDRPEEAAELLCALKRTGIRLAIDDFGVGYSSLSHLRQFPIDILKIDRSFVESITEEQVPPIVDGVLQLAQAMRLQTVAEGISTAAQTAALIRGGCELGQGFYFARPVDAEGALALLRAGRYVLPIDTTVPLA
jgi:diguanylate cyclase (GGDEF)-like protein